MKDVWVVQLTMPEAEGCLVFETEADAEKAAKDAWKAIALHLEVPFDDSWSLDDCDQQIGWEHDYEWMIDVMQAKLCDPIDATHLVGDMLMGHD